MPASTNPYACYCTAVRSVAAESRWVSLLFTMAGVLLATVAALGSVFRLAHVIQNQDPWRTLEARIGDVAPIMGLSIFAVTACVLLVVMDSRGVKRAADLSICQAFITLATLAMLMRIIFEPSSLGVPQWPAYLLTTSAGIAMSMVFARIRRSLST